MVDQGGRPRIGQQILQLTLDIPEVDIEWGNSRLEAAEQCLHEFVSVVRVDAEQVLAHLMTGKRGAVRVAAQSPGLQVRGEVIRPLDRLRVAEAPVAMDQEVAVRNRGRNGLGDSGYCELYCGV